MIDVVLFVGQAHKALSAAEQVGKRLTEILVDAGKSLIELQPGDLIDFADRRLSIFNRIHQVLTLTFEEAYGNNHSNGATVTSQAERYEAVVDCSAFTRIRVVVDNANSGQGIKAQVLYATLDSVG